MGGGKGQKTTTTTTQVPQLPQLQEAWQGAQNIYQNATPANMIATLGDPTLLGGIDNLLRASYGAAELTPQANQFWQQGGQGSIYNSPAYGYFQNMARNATPEQGWLQEIGAIARAGGQNFSNAISAFAPQIAGYAGQAGANDNLGLSQLGKTAQGDYINGNPWFSQMVQSAMDPITRNFQTAVAPQLDASFANSGRYGSGAMLGQRENAQTVLADTLAKTSSNMYGQNYAQERQNQLNAAQNYGQLWNQGLAAAMQGLGGAAQVQQGAANTLQQGVTTDMNTLNARLNSQLAGANALQSGYQGGNAAALQAANMYPQLAAGQAVPAELQRQAGQLYNAWQQQYLDQPSNAVDRYLKQLGAVSGGSSTTTPYFSNPMANAMAGITGGMDIMQKMGGMGGLGGSSQGGYPASISSPSGQWVTQPGMGQGIYTNLSSGVTSDVAGSGFPGIPQVAGAAANAAKKI